MNGCMAVTVQSFFFKQKTGNTTGTSSINSQRQLKFSDAKNPRMTSHYNLFTIIKESPQCVLKTTKNHHIMLNV